MTPEENKKVEEVISKLDYPNCPGCTGFWDRKYIFHAHCNKHLNEAYLFWSKSSPLVRDSVVQEIERRGLTINKKGVLVLEWLTIGSNLNK